MKFLTVLIFYIFFSALAFGQKTVKTYNEDSTMAVIRDSRFDQLVAKQKEQNLSNQSMPGYRIQIYFGGNRQKASEAKLNFNSKFADIPAYITYQQPNFKVRVGDFRNRYDAQKMMKDLEGMYPTLFIVPDEVKLPSIK